MNPTFDDGLIDMRRRGWSVTITPDSLEIVTQPGVFPSRHDMPTHQLLSGPTLARVIAKVEQHIERYGHHQWPSVVAASMRPRPIPAAWLLY